MLFSPSAYFGGTAAPTAWHRAVAAGKPLFLQLKEAQESALAASCDPSGYQLQGERMAGVQQVTQAATGDCLGWAKGIAADGHDGRVQAVAELSGANPQPRLTGPLLPRAGTAGPGRTGPCGACLRVGC
jgi:hypothetical protein